MTKGEVLYTWLSTELESLCYSDATGDWVAGLLPQDQIRATEAIEALHAEKGRLQAASTSGQHYADWSTLRSHIKQYLSAVPGLSPLAANRLDLFVMVAGSIAQAEGSIDNEELDTQEFRLEELTLDLSLPWFVYANTSDLHSSVVILNLGRVEEIVDELTRDPIPSTLGYRLLPLLITIADVNLNYAMVTGTTSMSPSSVRAFVELHILASGRPVYMSQAHASTPAPVSRDAIKAGVPYQQWSDVFVVLSEYNSRSNDVLLKYLTIYHTIENFMFKLPIVQLERQREGAMFSIRDFQDLYRKTTMKEKDALEALLKKLLVSPGPLADLLGNIQSKWTNLVLTIGDTAFDAALGLLQFNSSDCEIMRTKPMVVSRLAGLVYATRNSIVHNKATEFHLTSANLNPNLAKLISDFLLPCLEELCYAIVTKRNDQLWYSRPSILLID